MNSWKAVLFTVLCHLTVHIATAAYLGLEPLHEIRSALEKNGVSYGQTLSESPVNNSSPSWANSATAQSDREALAQQILQHSQILLFKICFAG